MLVATKKRWNRIYEDGNPLSLPQQIRKQIRKGGKKQGANVRFLWLILTGDPKEVQHERWLNVIDESAAVGADTLIVSVSGPLEGRPYIWQALRWACDTHEMSVGLHLFEPNLTDADLEHIHSFDSNSFCLFVCDRFTEGVRALTGDSVRIVKADGLADGVPQPTCNLPKEMTCVSSGGEMYTCGLVQGNNGFYLGDASDERIDYVKGNANLPHAVPAGTSEASGRCEGCPPLLQARLQEALRQ